MLKEVEFTMDEGRDAGKTFKIKEMPAYQMDKWVTRLLGCFAKENITIGDVVDMSFVELTNNIYKIDSEEEKKTETQSLLETPEVSADYEKILELTNLLSELNEKSEELELEWLELSEG